MPSFAVIHESPWDVLSAADNLLLLIAVRAVEFRVSVHRGDFLETAFQNCSY